MSLGHAALIVVDVQKDFCEGGALAVEGGNAVAEEIARFLLTARSNYAEIVFTKDWHNPPPDTNGGHFDQWPVHCVADSLGSALHQSLSDARNIYTQPIFYKGQGTHGYSGFEARLGEEYLDDFLRGAGIDEVHVVGIAGDFCVRATALDAKTRGYRTYLLPWMIASVGGPEATAAVQLEVATLDSPSNV